jgi:hypothetical protein
MTTKRDRLKMEAAINAFNFLAGIEGIELVGTKEPVIETNINLSEMPKVGVGQIQQIRERTEQTQKLIDRKEALGELLVAAELKMQILPQAKIKTYLEEIDGFDFQYDLLVPKSLVELLGELEFDTQVEKKEFLSSVTATLNRYLNKQETEKSTDSVLQIPEFELFGNLKFAPCIITSNSFKNTLSKSNLAPNESNDLQTLVHKINIFFVEIWDEYESKIPAGFGFYDTFVNRYIGDQNKDYIYDVSGSNEKEFMPSSWKHESPFGNVTARYKLGKGKRVYLARTTDNMFELIAFDNDFGHF